MAAAALQLIIIIVYVYKKIMIRILCIPHVARKLTEVAYEEANALNNTIRPVFRGFLFLYIIIF